MLLNVFVFYELQYNHHSLETCMGEINCQSINGAWCTYGFIHSQVLFLVLQLIVAHSMESLLQPVILISDEVTVAQRGSDFSHLHHL